jgi:hypothetical protein
MQGFATASPNRRWYHHLLRLVTTSILVCSLALVVVSPLASSQEATTPTPALAPNGCPAEWADQSYICPEITEPSYPLIEYLYSDPVTDAIAIRLTSLGMKKALTCDGAAEVSSIVIDQYERIPREERARDSIDWAEDPMIDEIRAHARLGQYPQFRSSANPVDIVFPHYDGAYGTDSGRMWNFSQQVVFGSVWSCE